jgi:hypothetical protein
MPGKFEGNENEQLAELLHEASLNGELDEEIGSVDELGWYGRFIDRVDLFYYILNEDSQGFFSYEQYPDLPSMNQAWEEIESMYATFDNADLTEIMA